MRLIQSLITTLLLLSSFFCMESVHAASMTNGGTATYKWKFATMAPRGIGWAKQVEEHLFPAIMEECEGEVFIKVYWGGVLGEDKDVVALIHKGRLAGGGFTGQGATLLCKEFALFELPFLFNDYGEVDYIKEKMQHVLDKAANREGFKLFLWNDQDFDQIYSTARPISTLEDMKQSTFIVWYGPLEEKLLYRMGAPTVSVDVSSATMALRQGKADAGFAPALWVSGAQLYSVIRYVNPVKIRYSPAPIAASLEAWRSLPQKYQERLENRQRELQDKFCQGVREDNAKSLKAMIQYGLEEVRSTPLDLEKMREKAVPVWNDMAGILYSQEMLDEVLDHLKTYRTPSL